MTAVSSYRHGCLSGSMLKLIAVISMLIDHTGLVLLAQFPSSFVPLFTLLGYPVTLYWIVRGIGRIAFPIFCFLLLEGFYHTSNRMAYARSLLVFAVLSEIPFNLMLSGKLLYPQQNVFFTLLIGYLTFWALEETKGFPLKQLAVAFAGFSAACIIRGDYGVKGYLFLLLLYLLRMHPFWQTVLGCISLSWEWLACFAFIPIRLYNGQRGFIHGKVGKYFFYLFYPLHILILVGIRCCIK